jgi:glycosyltransferase involved in cell wall biosynthesis
MNILHLIGDRFLPDNPDQTDVSGVVRVALELARLQVQQGHQVTIAAIGKEARSSTWHGVRLLSLRPVPWARVRVGKRVLDFRLHLPYVFLTRRQRFDIVHGHLYIYLRFLRARGHIAHIHGDPFYRGSRNEGIDLKPLDLQCIARYTNRQVAISKFVADELKQGLGNQGNVYTIYNGIDLAHFAHEQWARAARQLRSSWGVPDDGVVFLFAGAITSEKGVIHLARAFERLSHKAPVVHLALAGSSELWQASFSPQGLHREYEMKVRETLQDLHKDGRVHFLGRVSSADMPAVFHASDVTVVPSVWREGFGLVAVEALASGCPVIASRTGGLVEIVNEQNGLLVPVGDEQALEDAMLQLTSDPQRRQQLGEYARLSVQRFSWQKAVQELDQLYQEILTA